MTTEETTTNTLAKFTEADIKAQLASLAAIEEDSTQWAELMPDYGKEVEFAKVGDSFVGILANRRIVPVPDLENPGEMRDAMLFEFLGTDAERYAIWGSYSIENKLDNVADGTPVRIEYRGIDQFNDKVTGAPRQVKRFKVLLPVSGEHR